MTPVEPEAQQRSGPACARVHARRVWIGLVLLLFACWLGWFAYSYFARRPIAPSGGIYFPWRVELRVPHFQQQDEHWRDDRLAWTDGTLGGEGCAVSAAAMVLKFYGIATDPRRLNGYLSATGGYTIEGWIYWEAAANLAPGRVRFAYENTPSYWLIDRNLIRGNPVIVRVRLKNGVTHFVVVAGKQGFDYLICDPMAEEGRGCYPLRELGSDIEALRFYERL